MSAEKTLDKISEDGWRWFDEAYNQSFRIDYVSSMNACRREGRAEGKEEKAIEAARKMLTRNYPVNEIAEITGLSIEKIAEISAELAKEVSATTID